MALDRRGGRKSCKKRVSTFHFDVLLDSGWIGSGCRGDVEENVSDSAVDVRLHDRAREELRQFALVLQQQPVRALVF